MKKILLLVSGLLILCMAGSAMADPFDASIWNAVGDASAPNPINLAPGQSVVLSLHGSSFDPKAINANLPYNSQIAVKPGSPATATSSDLTVTFAHDLHPTSDPYTDKGVITLTNVKGPVGASYLITINAGETSIDFGAASRTVNSIPEFPTIAAPVAAVLGLLFVLGRKKEGL